MTFKICEKSLLSFLTPETPTDREGWLELRLEPSKSYQRRWFVLKANLLFYFYKKGDKHPAGFVVVEGCTVELTEEEDAFSFKIVFRCEGGWTYYLTTDSQSDMEGWMKAITCASYDFMKLVVADLERQLEDIAAATAAPAVITPPEGEPKVPPRGQRYNPFNKMNDTETKAVQPTRQHKEVCAPDAVTKATAFRDIHKAHGRRLLADFAEWKARLARKSASPSPSASVSTSASVSPSASASKHGPLVHLD